jgi:membrane protease YdiL (CAAX protease family)
MSREATYPSFTSPPPRLALVRLTALALALTGTTVLATIATRLLVPPAPSPLHQWVLLKNLLLPVLLLAVYARSVHWLERRTASEIDVRRGAVLSLIGAALGIAIIGGYVLVLWTFGAAHVSQGLTPSGALNVLNEFLVPWLTAVGEELLFRVVLFRIAEEMFGTASAVLISAALFALSHGANPAANPASLFALAAGMGVLLALAFSVTRNVWFPIGLHMGWNLAEGFLFGLPNSGVTDPLNIAHTTVSGSPALTGGAFGPEASVVLLALSVVVSVALFRLTLRLHRWRAPRFQMRAPPTGA